VKWLTNKTGDVRDRVVFAWRGKKCADVFTRRFVFLNVREVYNESRYMGEDKAYSEGWEAKRWTPITPDPVAEAEAAAAQAVRDSRPKPPALRFTLGGAWGISSVFGESTIEGDEWKSGADHIDKTDDPDDEDDDDDK
jgi:hypothetical protein